MLQFGYEMRVPILDLEVDDEAISGTLSFNRRPFWCRIPWNAVFAIVDEERKGVRWPEDGHTSSQVGAAPAPKRSHLRAVGPEDDAPAEDPDASTLEGEGTCGTCNTRWPEDLSSCPVCGSSRGEAFKPLAAKAEAAKPEAAEAERGEIEQTLESSRSDDAAVKPAAAQPALASVPPPRESDIIDDDDPPPPPPPPRGRPQLRLVKK